MCKTVITTAMMCRMGIVMGAFVSGYMLANVTSIPQEIPNPMRVAQSSALGRNPFGSLEMRPKDGQPAVRTVSMEIPFDGLRDDYFIEMLNPPAAMRPFLPTSENAASPRYRRLPIGCEPIGSVASKLWPIASRCLT